MRKKLIEDVLEEVKKIPEFFGTNRVRHMGHIGKRAVEIEVRREAIHYTTQISRRKDINQKIEKLRKTVAEYGSAGRRTS